MSAKRILVVDDNPDVRSTIGSLLEYEEYEVSKAVDGTEAWSLVTKGQVDLILSDYDMPEMNGMELLRLVRCKSRDPCVPFVLMSAHKKLSDGRELEGVCAELGADFVIKGEEPRDLLALIARRLS